MGIRLSDLNDKQLGMIDAKDRKGKAGRTWSEIQAEAEIKTERDLHDKFIAFLNRHQLGYYHCNPTKPATIKTGMPDFGIYDQSRILFVEFKVNNNDLSPVQKEQIAKMIARKNVVFICNSYQQATELIRKFFHLTIDDDGQR